MSKPLMLPKDHARKIFENGHELAIVPELAYRYALRKGKDRSDARRYANAVEEKFKQIEATANGS